MDFINSLIGGGVVSNNVSQNIAGYNAHAEGDSTTASGDNSHAEGLQATASGGKLTCGRDRNNGIKKIATCYWRV